MCFLNFKWFFVTQLKFTHQDTIRLLFNSTKYNLPNICMETVLRSFVDKELYFMLHLITKNASLYSYNFLSDMTVVHVPTKTLSLKLKTIVRNFSKQKTIIFSFIFGIICEIPTISLIFQSANWSEREIFDMFGICFYNHPNLRRILTDYGFKGFPLLKNFPVYGFKELRFDLQNQQLVYTPVVLTQKWRNYLFLRQWK